MVSFLRQVLREAKLYRGLCLNCQHSRIQANKSISVSINGVSNHGLPLSKLAQGYSSYRVGSAAQHAQYLEWRSEKGEGHSRVTIVMGPGIYPGFSSRASQTPSLQLSNGPLRARASHRAPVRGFRALASLFLASPVTRHTSDYTRTMH